MTKFIINKSDIVHNYNEICKNTSALVIPMLKADCYGLGAKKVLEILKESCSVSLAAVSRLEEAHELCDSGCEILITSCLHDAESIKAIVDSDIICAVDSQTQAKAIGEYAKSVGKVAKVHIKIDTGFGRFGFMPENTKEIKSVFALENVKVCGIFSHFSAAFADAKETDRQFELFTNTVDNLTKSGLDVGIRHIANSSGFVRNEKYHLDAIRTGSLLLGRLPMPHSLDLKRVGRFESDISDIRELKKGANIGYGGVFRLKQDCRVAVLCTGSADGVLIGKSYDTYRVFDIFRYGFSVFKMLFRDNRLCVTINGKRTRAVGRVALTHTMVDVTGIDCECGDKAVIDISPLYISSKVEREYI